MKILFVDPFSMNVINFRKELINRLLEEGHEVVLLSDLKEKNENLFDGGLRIIYQKTNLHSLNLFNNFKLLFQYKKILKKEQPQIVLTYTIKPNIFFGLIKKNAYQIANITGLGTAFNKKNFLYFFIKILYRFSFKNVNYVLFQNKHSKDIFKKMKVCISNSDIIPGSGVNLLMNKFEPYPNNENLVFLFIARIIKEKGIDLYINAAKKMIENGSKSSFLICGNPDRKYTKIMKQYSFDNQIRYIGNTNIPHKLISKSDVIVLPSYYHEGISNVLLEACSSGRPIITSSDNPGCMETIVDGVNGFSVPMKNQQLLIEAMKSMEKLSRDEREKMGIEGRKFIEKSFDRNIVISKYLKIIDKISKK